MKLYLLTQDDNDAYDTYDSMVVCAENEEEARMIYPSIYSTWEYAMENNLDYWANKPENVVVEYIGEAKEGLEKGVVVASFNAG